MHHYAWQSLAFQKPGLSEETQDTQLNRDVHNNRPILVQVYSKYGMGTSLRLKKKMLFEIHFQLGLFCLLSADLPSRSYLIWSQATPSFHGTLHSPGCRSAISSCI